jgi:RimJ/RimL family protein N-acetyltransferase
MSPSDTASREREGTPVLRKARSVRGANLLLRNATPNDAEFILSLRLDPAKNRHIQPTSPRLADQMEWLTRYEAATDQAYFVVCDGAETRIGCVRLYDPAGRSYCWGSWLMVSGLSPLVSIEANLLVYAYGDWLGFNEVRLDVRRDNEAVWKFHEKFSGAIRVGETELDYLYLIGQVQIQALLQRYRHLLTTPLAVLPMESA